MVPEGTHALVDRALAIAAVTNDLRVALAHSRSPCVPLMLADSWKFEHSAFCEVSPIRASSEVITDPDIRKADHVAMVRAGVAVAKASTDPLGA
jgi:hypothetical protein